MTMEAKRLTRSNTNAWLLGVCGGLADYFGIDPTIVRLAWAILTVASFGFGVLAYLIAALIMPRD